MDSKMFKYLKLTSVKGPNHNTGPILINVAYVMSFLEWSENADRAPITRIWLPNGGILDVKESVEDITRWIAKSENCNDVVINDNQ